MRSTCDEVSDLIIPAFDANGQTLSLVIDLHPGLFRTLNYVLKCDHLPFRDLDAAIRWCIASGLHTLLALPLNASALAQPKVDVMEEERFQSQNDCLAIAVEKFLAAGNKQSAARLVALSFEEYAGIRNEYLRALWLSTLSIPIELLRQQGIPFKAVENCVR